MVCLGDIFCRGPGASHHHAAARGLVGGSGRDSLMLVADTWAERGVLSAGINLGFLAGKSR